MKRMDQMGSGFFYLPLRLSFQEVISWEIEGAMFSMDPQPRYFDWRLLAEMPLVLVFYLLFFFLVHPFPSKASQSIKERRDDPQEKKHATMSSFMAMTYCRRRGDLRRMIILLENARRRMEASSSSFGGKRGMMYHILVLKTTQSSITSICLFRWITESLERRHELLLCFSWI